MIIRSQNYAPLNPIYGMYGVWNCEKQADRFGAQVGNYSQIDAPVNKFMHAILK